MAYELEGRLLEVCNCNILCPCWVGEDPDNGTCDTVIAWHFDKGTINGVDVSGLTLAVVAHVPGNILKGNWRAVVFVDDKAAPQQQEALLNVYTGKLGGPVAELVQLIGEVVGMERAPISFDVKQGKGRVTIGSGIEAELAPFQGPTGQPTSLHESVFSTIPGAPAYVGKASTFKAKVPSLGFNINLQGHNAIQGSFRFVG
ncbi:MAG: hypothetical protein XU11_C0053G0008 [Candidatus Dadabacteria bacterium CSP1-2]|jgi:hypothetical protein|nr:MAG: hypothetical protein XU11_C0053G0008 [Candidatus Dadabacteria bacterium CSP1-2]OGE20443.1 MAG: hypothetical protein A2V51_05145 [Candidatus Dadabacteria bacterium RBG_19FT_COMBO_40_33]